MPLFQPPLNSNVHSLLVPVLTGPLQEAIEIAAPETSTNFYSKARRLPNDAFKEVQSINLVLIFGHNEKRSHIESYARQNGMGRASIRHVLSLAATKPRLYEDLTPTNKNQLPLIAVVATERAVANGHSRIPVLWFWGDYHNPKKPPSRSLGLFQDYREEYWDHYYWFAFVAKQQ